MKAGSAVLALGAGRPRLLRRLVLRSAFVRFAGGEAFLVLIFMLADLFSSMWRFLALEAPTASILLWVAAGIPSHISEVLPIALLFGITLTLAELHADGELLVICGSGISVQSLAAPLALLSFALAGFMFIAGDLAAIPATIERDRLYASMTGQKNAGRQVANIAIIADSGRMVYKASFFDTASSRLVDPDVSGRGADGALAFRILARKAEWLDDAWTFTDARVFERTLHDTWTEIDTPSYRRPGVDEPPASFAELKEKPSLMNLSELRRYVGFLERSGLPSAEAETEYHKRYSFLLTPLIVCGLSVSFAGLFRKNSLLMSLLFSLGTATVYYVAQMLGTLAAKTGWAPPFWGVWGVTIAFFLIAAVGFFKAKT